MQSAITNHHSTALILNTDTGRFTIPPGETISIDGDLSEHILAKGGLITVDVEDTPWDPPANKEVPAQDEGKKKPGRPPKNPS